MAFRVNVTPQAQRDAEDLYRWVVSQAPLRGPLWFNGLMDIIRSLSLNPRRCPLARGLNPVRQIRQLLYGRKPYRIFFHVKGEDVHILHIRHGAQKPWAPDEP
jgi:plasmid stabilization system protein ParE